MSYRTPFPDDQTYEPARTTTREQKIQTLKDCLAHLAALEPAGMGAKVIACPLCGENMVQKIGAHTGKFILAHCRIYIAEDTRELAVAEFNKAD